MVNISKVRLFIYLHLLNVGMTNSISISLSFRKLPYLERTLGDVAIMMDAIGPCGNFLCLDAWMLELFLGKSMSVRKPTRTHTFVSWHLTMSAKRKLWQLWCTNPLYNYHDLKSLGGCESFILTFLFVS